MPRLLAVSCDATREAELSRRVDPDAHVVVVAEHPVQGADALDHDDALGPHQPEVRRLTPRRPVEAVKARNRTLEQRVDDLASKACEHELRAVPELVRADHLGPGDQARERALSRAAAAADPDKE